MGLGATTFLAGVGLGAAFLAGAGAFLGQGPLLPAGAPGQATSALDLAGHTLPAGHCMKRAQGDEGGE